MLQSFRLNCAIFLYRPAGALICQHHLFSSISPLWGCVYSSFFECINLLNSLNPLNLLNHPNLSNLINLSNLTNLYLHRHRRFYPSMALIIFQLKIFKFKIENIFYFRIDFHLWQWKWRARQLQIGLFKMIVV